ncbi:MAG: hypothetical protein ACI9CE_003630, partial [Flavobacterium sp.]
GGYYQTNYRFNRFIQARREELKLDLIEPFVITKVK